MEFINKIDICCSVRVLKILDGILNKFWLVVLIGISALMLAGSVSAGCVGGGNDYHCGDTIYASCNNE